MKSYDGRIKKFILKAVENGTLIRTKGQGLRGRFTVAGWKPPKKKRKMKMTKWDKDDGPEYQPKKTARDDDKEKVHMLKKSMIVLLEFKGLADDKRCNGNG